MFAEHGDPSGRRRRPCASATVAFAARSAGPAPHCLTMRPRVRRMDCITDPLPALRISPRRAWLVFAIAELYRETTHSAKSQVSTQVEGCAPYHGDSDVKTQSSHQHLHTTRIAR